MDRGCLSRELIYEFIDGELEDGKSEYINEHVKRCERCRNELELSRNLLKTIENALASGESSPAVSVKETNGINTGQVDASDISRRVMGELEEEKRKKTWAAPAFKLIQIAAGFMLCILVLSALYISGYSPAFVSALIGDEGYDAGWIDNDYVEFLFAAHFEGTGSGGTDSPQDNELIYMD